MKGSVMTKIKRIAAVTMVRDDQFFLEKWVNYYGKNIGKENLYIIFDGEDQKIPDFCSKVNTIVNKRIDGNVQRADKGRINLINEETKKLFSEGYEVVIGCDVDEFLVLDPKIEMPFAEYISALRSKCVSGLGLDVGQDMRTEKPIDTSKLWLLQRHAARLSTRYTKPCVMTSPGKWGRGFHRQLRRMYTIDENLYLFHLGCIDMEMIQKKLSNFDLISRGWNRHLRKRVRTIILCSEQKAHLFDIWAPRARKCQNFVHPIYSWNKPSMFGMTLIVEIPKRFSHLL